MAKTTLDTIAQALAWIEYQGDFAGYMLDHEYNSSEATRAFNACYEAYQELSAEKNSIVALAKHFDNL